MSASTTLVVMDPRYTSRVLVSHEGLTATDALELLAIYDALGYPQVSLVTVTTPAQIEDAA